MGKILNSSKVIPKVIYYIVLYRINILVGIYPPLATGKCESCQHIKVKRDYVLGGTLLFAATGGASKGTGWATDP